MSEQTTNHEFRAETRKVLNILTHSLYSNREIFLRELISNASDALDKLRFLQSQTQHEAIRDADLPLEIRISSDKVQNCLTITDTGIGMTRDEMIENLGTIAHSGSEAFLKEHTQTAEDGTTSDASNIIGRFGIGFYSVFMVADKVEVTSLSATGDGPAYRWISDGTGTFTVEEAPDRADIKRGTTIRAFIKEGDKEFLEKYRIEGIIRTHSSFIPFPILVDGERVNTTPALWREPKFSIKKEQYDEFYKFLTYDQKDPLDVLHLSVDAPVQFNALLFIPDITKDYFGAYREHWGLDLYARRVLIQRENKELIPDYLAFLKGVVDTEDLPLNISRETLQENIVLRKISQTISKQILSHLEKMAKDDAEKYNSFWKLHGKVFKLGYSDFVNRDRITPLLRFNSSAMEDADGLTSLDDYISRARESQKEIWYVAAPSREAAKVNPHSEVFRRKGLEVLYLYEPVDEFALETLAKYKDYTFKAVEHADSAVLDAFADTDEQPKAAPLSNEDMNEFDKLLETIRKVLGDHVEQAGSYTANDHIRFDFTHFAALTAEELAKVEDMVNDAILAGSPVITEEMSIDDAKKKGAMALFGEKYGQTVRVVQAGDSIELCGGTHLDNTAKAGSLKIIGEASVAAGVRRIEAVTGKAVLKLMNDRQAVLNEAAAALKTNPNELSAKIEQQVNDMRALNKKLEKMGAKVAAMQMVDLFNVSRNIKGVEVVATKLDDASADMLRTMGDDIKGKKDNMVAVLSAVNGDKVSLLCVCGAEAVKKGAHAGKIIKEVAKIVGGGGGGRPDSATAGGKNPAKLEEALEAVNNIVDAML